MTAAGDHADAPGGGDVDTAGTGPAGPPTPGDAGAASTELVVVFPAVLLLISLTLQFGLYLHAAQVAEAAAQEAVDAAQAERDTAADGRRAAERLLVDLGTLDAATVDVSRDAAAVRAVVTGRAPRLLPGVELDVSVTAEGPVERFVAEPTP